MKTLLYLLLLCAAIRLTQSACPTATVEMHRLEQSGDEGDPITLNFNLGCELEEAIYSIDLTYTDVEASATTDFSGPTTVDIPTGVLFFSTMLTLVDDDIVEIDETFLVEVESIGSTASPTGTVSIILGTTQLTTTVTIEDDDTVTVSIAPSLIQLQEMDGSTDPTATLTLEWFGLVDLPSFTVGVAYNADTTEDSDLTTGATSYELSLGTTNSITIPIVISSDDIVEEHESLTVSLTDVGYPNDFGRTDGIFLHSESVTSVVEILDDDTISVEFSADQSADEGSSVLVLFLFSNQVEDAGFSFSFSIPDTNVEAIDYNFIPSLQTVDIPTLTPDLTYTVLYTDDAKAEDDETVSFSINQVFSPLTTRNDAAEIGSKSTFEGTIEDDDDAIIKLSPTSMTLLESVGSYTQTILIDPQLEDEGYSVTLTTIDNVADHNLATQIHAIPACVPYFEVAVAIVDDNLVEDCETFSVSLSAVSVPSGFRSDVISLSDRTATVTIEDQDTATIGIQSIGTFTESDGLGTITLSLTVPTGGFADSGYSATVTITDGNTDGTADILTSYFEFELPQSAATAEVAVGLADNALFEDYESFTASIITVTPPTGYKRSGAGDTVIINSVENGISGVIEDDDNAVISFQSATLSGTENSNVIVTMVSDTAFEDAGFSISIDYNDAGDFDSAGMFADYSPVLTSTIPTATTTFSFLLSVSGDSWVEDTESVTLSFDSLIYPGTYSRGTGASFSTPSSTTEVQISDDDSAVVGLTTASLPVTEGDGADVTSTVTFSLDNTVLVSGFVIDLSWDDLTAIDGSDAYDDYNSGPSTVEIPTGTLVGTFLFEVPSNEIVEDHESFSISLTGITNPTLTRVDDPVTVGSSSSATVVIEDDDTATLCFDTSVNTVTEGVSSVTNTLSLTVDSEIEDSITVALTFNTGTADGQFTNAETGETVDIPTDGPAGTSHPISVVSDMKIEDHQTFTAILGARTNADGGYSRDPDDAVTFEATCSSLAVTILDDDTATIEMDLRDIEGGEEDGNVIINVDISGGVLCTEGFSATLSYDDITATGGSDYANTNVHIPIPTYTGTSDQFNFLLTFTSDQIVEDHERFNVILTEVGALPAFSRTDFIVVTDVAIDQSTSVTIIDDDSATLTVVSDTACHAEDDGTATVTLTLDNQVEDDGFKFGVTYSDIDANVGTDFIGTVTLGDFATLTNLFSFTVSLVDDEVVEFEQSFSLSLAPVSIPTSFIRSDPFVYIHATSRTATVTIKDDDTATVSLSSKVTALESSGLAEVVVLFSNPIEDPTSFSATFAYSDKTAADSSDYAPGPSSAVFPSDPATELTITVAISDDNVVEDLESFCVLLTGVSDPLTSNSLLIASGEESTTVCITDDDTATVGISVTSSVVEDDTTLTVTLAYSGGTIADSGFTAEISYTGDAEAGSDYNQVTEHIIPPNSASSEFDLVIVGDDVVESDEKAILELFNIQHPFTSRTSGAVVVFPIPSSATQTVTIVNDDTATCTLSTTSVCVDEGDGTIDIELVCSNPVQDDGFTIGILYEEDSALDVNDYTGTLDTVPFPTAETTFSFSVELVDDEIVEDTQSFIVRTPSADDERLLVLTSTLTVTIKDDDTVTCSLLTTDESSDENTGPVPIEVLCDLQVEEEGFSLDIGYSPKSAGTPSDFGTTVITVPVPTATTTVTFNVGIVNDEIVEDIESFCITLDGIDLPGGFTRTDGAEITPSTATVTISDDDTAICSLDQTPVCVEEGVNDHATITVSCDKVIQDGGVDVDLVYRDADAFNPGDYIDAPQQVNLPVGSTTTEFQVSIVDDSEIESSESFEILLVSVADTAGFTRSDAVELGVQTTTVTIKNDDSVTCSFATSEVTVDEFDGFLSVEVECNGVHAKDGVSFEFDYTEGTATQPEDFDSIVTTIGFPSSTTSLSFSISIVPDEIVEKDHSFTISLSNVILPEGVDENCISFMGSQVVTILDDDTATCRFDPTEDCVTEGTSPFIASVTCDLQVDCPGITFDVALSDGTAVETSDYTTNDGTFSFDINTNDLSFEVGIADDSNVENHQSFTVGVSMVNFPEGFDDTAAIQFVGTQIVTIKDDDTTTCSLDPALHDVDESQSGTVTIVCDNQVDDEGVSLNLCFTDGTAEDGVDYVSTDPFPFPTGTTTFSVELDIVDDVITEDVETFDVEICDFSFEPGFSATTAFEATGSAQCRIIDDDSVTCSFATSEVTVDEFDGFLSVEVECNGVHAKDGVSFEFDYTEGTATEPEDFNSIVTTIGFPTATTSLSFSISIVPDTIVEKDHSFTISLSNVIIPMDVDQNCISFTGSQVVTILDDDTATCRFDPTEDCVTEGTSPFIASVTCDLQVECPGITFDVDLSDGTAVETGDFMTNDITFSFDINTNDLSFEVGIADDSNVENHQSFTVGVSGVNFPDGFDDTAAVQFVGTQIVTIKDDDTTTCSLDPALHDVDESQSGTVMIVCDNQADDEGVSLNLCFTDGTAEDGVDYVSTDPFPFPTGTTTFSVELEIVDDTIIEGDETFDVEICDFSFEPGFSATTAFEVTGSAQCQIDDDDFADCSFTPVSQCLFEEDGFFTISIACSKATDVAGFEIGIQGFDLDAESTSDYVVPSPRIEIPVETLEFTTLIEIVDDNEQEEDEEFYVMFGSTFQPERFPRTGVFSLLPPVTFTLTIKDNDEATTQSPLTTMGSTAPSEETTQATTEQTTTSKPEQPTTDQTTDQTTPADYHTQEQQDRNLPFEPQPCQLECLGQHMECMAVEGIARCNCTVGYELVNAEVCQDQNECALSPCSGGVYEMCINTDGSYFCECNEGYGRSVSGDCEDNDECLVSPCLDYQDCVNLDGGFSCVCRDGFLTTADDICVDIDECSTGVDDCHLFTNTLCKNTIGHFVCACVDGFVRNPSGACSLLEECEPDFKETCQFPEEFCYVNELRENFCGCSPGYDRLSPSSQCENRDECLDVPDVCRSVENSHCVDEIPSVDDPNRFYVCECTEGYREIVTGICMKEIQLRLGMVITEVNNERALNLWSEELTDTDSQRFQQFSEFLCSFFHESVLSSPDVNQTSCRGLGFAEDATGMYVALELTVVPTSNGEAATADKIKESLLQDANFEGEGVYIWEKSNRDSITVQTTSLDVQALEDIGCSRSLCQNGGTCVFDENVYRTACSCPDGFEGEVCQNEITQNEVDSNLPEETTAPSSIGLLIGVTIGAFIFALVMIGLCCLLLRSPNKDAGRKQSAAFTEVPLRLTARPLGTRDPSVVRNPLATRHLKPGSHTNDDDDYDDLRMRRLETSFVKMGSPRSNASHSTTDSDDDGSSTTSPEFTLPYAADGSVNV